MALLTQATVDLANGNYLGNGSNLDLRRIQEPALSSVEGAVKETLALAKNHGLNISEAKENEIINNIAQKAKNPEKLGQYIVRGDFDWSGPNDDLGQTLIHRLEKIFTDKSGKLIEYMYAGYSPYTANIAALVRDAFEECGYANDGTLLDAFAEAQRDFVRKYNRETVNELKVVSNPVEDLKTAMQREAFGTRDIKTAIEMVIKQANYIANQNNESRIQNEENVLYQTYRAITEPAVQKACAYMAFLSAITGISTMYAGDELGMSGYDEKAKNVFLQNRNALPQSIKDKDNKTALDKYILDIETRMNNAMSTRNRAGIESISDGTLYEASTSNGNIPAIMVQNADGDFAVTVLNAEGIDKHNGTYSNQNQPIDYIDLVGAAALPVGYVLANSAAGDNAKYVVKEILNVGGKPVARIKNANGGQIVLNDVTAPNRVMVLGLDMKINSARKEKAAAEEAAKKAQSALKKAAAEVKNTVEETASKPETKEKVENAAETVANEVKKGNKKAWGIAAGAIAVAAVGYGIYRNSKKKAKKDLNVVG